jgi:hypothetical protein
LISTENADNQVILEPPLPKHIASEFLDNSQGLEEEVPLNFQHELVTK